MSPKNRYRKRPRPHTVRGHTRKGSGVNPYNRGSGTIPGQRQRKSGLTDECEKCGNVKMVTQREIEDKGKVRNVKWCDKCYDAYQKSKSNTIPAYAIRELSLWSSNDRQLYRHKIALALNYFRKKKRGVFNKQRALEGVANLHVPRIVTTYKKTGGNYIGDYYVARMSKADKIKVAEDILPGIMEQVEWYEKHPEDYKKDRKGY